MINDTKTHQIDSDNSKRVSLSRNKNLNNLADTMKSKLSDSIQKS